MAIRLSFTQNILCALFIIASLSSASQQSTEEDFQFDVNDGTEVEFTDPNETGPLLHRLWGIPDMTAHAGQMFALTIPQEAFSGTIKRYEAMGLRPWLLFDNKQGIFRGVPEESDIGEITITVRALGPHNEAAKDVFTIEIKDPKENTVIRHSENSCHDAQRHTVLSLFLNTKVQDIKPRQRVKAIDNIAGFFGMHYSMFSMKDLSRREISLMDKNTLKWGHGDSDNTQLHTVTVIQTMIGCSGGVWYKYKPLINQLGTQAKDGTISEVLGLPLIRWTLGRTPDIHVGRSRRQIEGSADEYDELMYDDYEDDYSENEDDLENTLPPLGTPTNINIPQTTPTHPHRHHHGEESKHAIAIAPEFESGPILKVHALPPHTTESISTVSYVPPAPNVTETVRKMNTVYVDNDDIDDDEDYESETEVSSVIIDDISTNKFNITTEASTITTDASTVPSSSLLPNTTPEPTEPDVETTEPTTVPTTTPTTPSTTTEVTTQRTTTVVVTTEQTTTQKVTTPEAVTNATFISSTSMMATEGNILDVKNLTPKIQHRLQKLPVTAGKAFRHIIPINSFHDYEDNTNLTLSMHDMSGAPLKHNSWVQFNPSTREVYGLPLENHVSKWEYVISATDRDGASVSDKLEITVQHHKGRRTVNHEITLAVRIEKRLKLSSDVDWQIRVLEGLAKVFGDQNTSQITVIHMQSSVEPLKITWTNDTLPRNTCPQEEIDALLSHLKSGENQDPSSALIRAMAPELRVKSVSGGGIGPCAPKEVPAPPRTPLENFAPIPRNQVDQLNVTVGHLLVHKVPEDSFYDPEDGSSRSLKMYLYNIDRVPLPPGHWLQFDTKNQEFYGVPAERDVGQKQYLLVCEDSGGLTAHDGLIVVVFPAPRRDHMVDFTMTLETPYESFISSANIQRKFVEKLSELFHDNKTDYIKINNIKEGSTTVTWSNTSLIGAKCLDEEIKALKSYILSDDDHLLHRVNPIMQPEFKVKSARMTSTGVCRGETNIIQSPPEGSLENDNTLPIDDSGDDYLITFIVPAVIIAAMLLLACVIACVLYRRRRTGKMELGDEEERQSFRSKGIPVIFQDELEEKPDPSNKSPVIMKDEKPPLLPPPEYKGLDSPQHGADSDDNAPYQPPPPFAASRGDSARNNRPKPTPTYRKPPPYVPP